MFRKRRLTGSGTSGNNIDQSRSKKQRVVDVAKILLDIAKESADCFPPLKAALGGVNALIKHYEQFKDVEDKIKDLKPQLDRFKQNITTTSTDGDPEEMGRRKELTRTLEQIEKRSQELLEKGMAAGFLDKESDSGEVIRLVERLREAITLYQISQQQAIYDQITNLSSSFGTLLKLHEGSPAVKNKLDSVMARLVRLCSDDDGLRHEDEHEHRAKLFNTLRLIRDNGNVLYNRISAHDYKECQDDIQSVSAIADDIRDAVMDYQMALQKAIYDQNREMIVDADLSVLNSCRRARGAGHQHGDRKGCLRGTRETVLNDIESWSRDFKKSAVFWLNGLAGTGKSTIAQTVSKRLFADGLLGASFFCSRDFEDRSNLHFIFPTIAFQLAHKHQKFRSVLVPLLQSNPDIVHESLINQMEELIVKPLKSADVLTIIVIDALDECKDEEPSSAILSVLGRFVEQIPTVKFFITGRPESRIETGFRLPLLVDSTKVFVLHDVHPSLINNDIRLFLIHELSELARRRCLKGWPSDEHIDVLCRRAAGLFVYAVATVKFLDSKTHLPEQRLNAIVKLPECTIPEGKTRFNSKTTLDSLYTSILEMAFSEGDTEVYSKARSIVGTVVLLANPLPPSGIAELIGLDPKEVALFLTLLQSLLILDGDSSQPVKPFHKSFPDFITSNFRCTDTRFYISPRNLHFELTINCLRVMNGGLKQNLLSLPDYSLNSEVEDLQTRINDRISGALQYACRSWHSHLIGSDGTGSNVTDLISYLHVFLKEKFLAWLEVVSVLGAVRGAVVALGKLIPWLQKVSGNGELLEIARDYFHFVTRFFEPINVSAAHIYHSALELSPLSSIVRRQYYDQRHAPLPRVAVGIQESWDDKIAVSSANGPYTWSPDGRFIAIENKGVVEIHDSLGFELLSTLKLTNPLKNVALLAYSTDGLSIAFISDTSLVIWDIQTGGVINEIDHGGADLDFSLLWSLDGSMIGIMGIKVQETRAYPKSEAASKAENTNFEIDTNFEIKTYGVRTCNVTSGTTHSPGTLQSTIKPHLWAYDTSFRVMTAMQVGQGCIIDISEVGSSFAKIESFYIGLRKGHRVESFSPTTYRISTSNDDYLSILDIRNSDCLLDQEECFSSCSFSSDGSLFATFSSFGVHTWKYTSGRYTPWRKLSLFRPGDDLPHSSLQFSPTLSSSLSSLLGRLQRVLYLWRLDDSPIVAHPSNGPQFAALSPDGNYVAIRNREGSTITIINLLSPTPSHIIDAGPGKVDGFALTGNILLVWDRHKLAAWRLTEEGAVDGVFPNGRADRSNSIWTISTSLESPLFFIQDQAVVIGREVRDAILAYHPGTGELFEPVQALLDPLYTHLDICALERDSIPEIHGL
ncbi:hypothetical protein F5887DRAFT_978796 [Amanita rubescens]|nr:hypothetical protein F5887DRAFT_978796 [Amanita rubescens]